MARGQGGRWGNSDVMDGAAEHDDLMQNATRHTPPAHEHICYQHAHLQPISRDRTSIPYFFWFWKNGIQKEEPQNSCFEEEDYEKEPKCWFF